MNIVNQVTWKNMAQNKTRTMVTVLGILLAAAMFTGVTTLGVSLVDYLRQLAVYQKGDYFIRFDYGTDENVQGVSQEKSVTKAGDLKALGYTSVSLEQDGYTKQETYVVAAGDQGFYDMVTVRLEAGRLPENSGEIVITGNLAVYLEKLGLPCGLGDPVTLSVTPEYQPEEDASFPELPITGTAFTREYRIVGINEVVCKLDDEALGLSYLLTYADDHTEQALWHRLYVKTDPAGDVYGLQDKGYGLTEKANTQLLELYGASRYGNVNTWIYRICGVLMAVILAGTVSLIYNAFSISVSERTKQFGLLRSVGATNAQLRRSVYFEAATLCAVGIPLGILGGYLGIGLTLRLTGHLIRGLLAGSEQSGIVLRAVPSGAAFAWAAAASAAAVFLSAWAPARRATKIPPIAAVRQSLDYQIPKNTIRSGVPAPGGLPGLLAGKYYTVSRRKYRAIVFSLTVSVALFLTAWGVSQSLQQVVDANVNTGGYDMLISWSDEEQIRQIRSGDGVADSALVCRRQYVAVTPEDALDPEYWQACAAFRLQMGRTDGQETRYVDLYYVEDAALRRFLEDQGIDPEPYFDARNPTALVMGSRIVTYERSEQGSVRKTYQTPVFSETTGTLTLYQQSAPEEVQAYLRKAHPEGDYIFWTNGAYQGNVVRTYYFGQPGDPQTPRVSLVIIPREGADGSWRYEYYLYDPETDTLSQEPAAVDEDPGIPLEIGLGQTVWELPLGVRQDSEAGVVSLVLPLSMAQESQPDLAIRVGDYQRVKAYLDGEELIYTDLLREQMQYKNLLTMVQVFSWDFLALMALVSMCNAFNTIATNIQLRRRDFGMLRSVGMEQRQLRKLVVYECLGYSLRALVIGVPLGTLAAYGIHCLGRTVGSAGFRFPLAPIGAAGVCVLIVALVSAAYGLGRLKREDPIQAIREE